MQKKTKKALSMLLVVALIAVIAIGGMLAYLTSEDSDVNVMTLGEVKITQNEQQRVEGDGEFTSELQPFKQGKVLMPYTQRAGEKDIYTVGTHQVYKSDNYNNYIDKIVSVTNSGKSDAYVRTLLAIPTGGEDWETTPVAAADTWLHWNTTVDMNPHWYSLYSGNENGAYNAVFTEINGQGYYVWEFTHKNAIEPGYTTFPTLLGCFMDNRVNHDETGYYMDMNSNGTCDDGEKRLSDIEVGGATEILVLSQGVQKEGFADSQTALDTAFGDVTAENAAEWFGNVKVPVVPSTPDEFQDALDNGEDVVLPNNQEVPADQSNGYGKTSITIHKGQTIDGAGHVLEAVGADGTWDTAINATGGTVKNLTVAKGFRGLFVNHDTQHPEKCGEVVLENVTIDGCTYTISCDQGTNNGLVATDCTFNGWTSYAATLGDAKFVNCSFGEGNGYAFMRPYAPTEFVGCDFGAGYKIDAQAAVTFENCTIGGVALTADNLATLVTSNTANATVK